MPPRARPLSPHLQVYRWQISNTLSIMHRLAGVVLSAGLLALAAWLVCIAGGAQRYESFMRSVRGPLGMLLLAAALFAFFFHFFNGIRHLFWDAGLGFERGPRRASGWAVVLGTVLSTVFVLIWAR
jgi:succinate dehydrogenase / fumarate reductase cytochrome b subunit